MSPCILLATQAQLHFQALAAGRSPCRDALLAVCKAVAATIKRLPADLTARPVLPCRASCKDTCKDKVVILRQWATARASWLSEGCGTGVVAFSFVQTACRSGWLLHPNGLQNSTWKLETSGGNKNCASLVNKQPLPGQGSFSPVMYFKWLTNQSKKQMEKRDWHSN